MFLRAMDIMLSDSKQLSVARNIDDPIAEPDAPIWYWQAGFWGFLLVVSFFTLTLWYNKPSWSYVAPIVIESAVGFLFSLVVQFGILRVWHQPPVLKAVISFLLVAVVSSLWTITRMWVYEVLTGEFHIWGEFGGWYFSSIFIFISWAALFYGVQYYHMLQTEHRIMLRAEADAREQQLEKMRAQATARDAQMKMLRYQLNPHFLCNTLNAINALIECEQSEKAQLMTVKLSQFLRHSLDNIPNSKITLENELNALNLYLQIEKIRFEDRLNLDFDVEDKARLAQIPSLLLQPIIENSMKHAIAKCEDGGTISLQAKVEGNMLCVTIIDSGPGVKIGKSKLQSVIGRGVGLKNTDERLQVVYGDNYTFDLNTSPNGGLQTYIKIPYQPFAQD
ncbi:sensor histidine kinase [Aestuariibacter salexigens]|uniref:sensor histidine kinase n=1 Tax=Aestuariibacter salexigens TaxID=226010 RepID=UPI001F0A9DB7|nr:histidine kinase [Aestuariibacter salexigens]